MGCQCCKKDTNDASDDPNGIPFIRHDIDGYTHTRQGYIPINPPINPDNYGRYGGMANVVGKEQKLPEWKTNDIKINGHDAVEYKVGNNGSIDIIFGVLMNDIISDSLNKELIEWIDILSKEPSKQDFRYMFRDRLMNAKNVNYGPWICEECFRENKRNDGNMLKCEYCSFEINKNEYSNSERIGNIVWKCQYCDTYNDGASMFSEFHFWCSNENCKKQNEDENEGARMKMYLDNERKYIVYENKESNDVLYSKYKIRIQMVIDPLIYSYKYWVPTIFKVISKKQTKIISDINSVSKYKYYGLYSVINKIFEAMMPMFEHVLNIDFNEMINHDLRVIISIQDYQFQKNTIYYGNDHVEGYSEENIQGIGIYYFDKNIKTDQDILTLTTTMYASGKVGDSGCGCEIGKMATDINIDKGKIVVFKNENLIHKLNVLSNINSNKELSRKILSFFVIKPNVETHLPTSLSNNIIYNGYENITTILQHWMRINNIKDLKLIHDIITKFTLYSYKKLEIFRNYLRIQRLSYHPSGYRNGVPIEWISIAN